MRFTVRCKFLIATLFATFWVVFSAYAAKYWLADLASVVGYPVAILTITIIALLPGFMNMFMLVAYLLDGRHKVKISDTGDYPPVTVLIAAYNEENDIQSTIESVYAQMYGGDIEIIVIDDGSKDSTVEVVRKLQSNVNNLQLLCPPHCGKASALNTGLAKASYELIITVDADTYLQPDAIYQLVMYFKASPANTAATSGSIYVRNSTQSFMARLQTWEYMQSIAAIKRVQGLIQGILVAQGAFSIYRKQALIEAGGWPDTVGEDIVLTWAILRQGYQITHAEKAVALTNVPSNYKNFFYQRSRWARGMLEAFRLHPHILIKRRLSTLLVYWDLLFPLIDFAYLFIFIPGVIAAFFGIYHIAGFMTLAVLPIAVLQNLVFFRVQRKIFKKRGLKFNGTVLSFIFYVLFYNVLMVFGCVHGYLSEMFSLKKSWGTKQA